MSGQPLPALPAPGRRPRPDALYAHVPFCFHKCHYCDFYSIVEEGAEPVRHRLLVRRLLAELRYRAAQVDLRPRTLFIGGGTPTLLAPDLWEELLAGLDELGVTAGLSEFTVEANPETVSDALLAALVRGGVTRVSLGAQSFQPHLLKTLERWHEPASVARAVAAVRRAGIDAFNLDLIFAIPGQTLELLEADLDAALALDPPHLSCYGLTFEPNTALFQRMRLGRIAPIDDDLERAMYERVIDRLEAAGYEHYEVSAFARREATDRRCRHNLVYWTNGSWLGVGPAAASHLGGRRWRNAPHLGRYLDSVGEPPIVDLEELPAERRLGEDLMLRLRLREGIEEAWLRQHMAADDPRWRTLADLLETGLLERRGPRLRLTRRGLMVADAILAELL